MTIEDPEPEYYEMTPREHVYTTRSGRKVYSTQRLVVPIPDNDEDAAELADFDSKYGEDCVDGLSDCSHDNNSNSDPNEEEDALSYHELEDDEDNTESVLCDSSDEDGDGGTSSEEEESENEYGEC